ncbi:hypothetical protein CA85_48880 [Allorhodopirellula solitaria]|uniref:Uncharacterized protein n=1 Tax=Allorhodopirellula solitaria TaxID=2527987 RepID=A0A5C5X052_9BACT|nr:hypothetical protein CA85_48880 [Allorhodopirellula solitaria]
MTAELAPNPDEKVGFHDRDAAALLSILTNHKL